MGDCQGAGQQQEAQMILLEMSVGGATYTMPAYDEPVRIQRIVSRPKRPRHPELGRLRWPVRAVLVAAGVVESEDRNVP